MYRRLSHENLLSLRFMNGGTEAAYSRVHVTVLDRGCGPQWCPPRGAHPPRGITTTGTGELRMIFVELEPRKTLLTGPSGSSRPRAIRLPPRERSSASSQLRPLTTPASTGTSSGSVASALFCASSAWARHCSATRRSAIADLRRIHLPVPDDEGDEPQRRVVPPAQHAASKAVRERVDPANAQVMRRRRAGGRTVPSRGERHGHRRRGASRL